ncbi:DEAD/DEAH box helicase [Arachnia rubra]|uniref:DEAD/DEAH box helicase n=1 Tax=Arachnia rubra TaxID=1547448 RepID=A0ABX7Y8U3_9ACTN|nr:DEAD/DEAH box helicase [Arachnia rubra]MBB1575990.1 DEAD/DEAH box helicase [Propionibacterium sp.]QUC09652.1 DEAD/DEAH box helicase [Arachnia rubra]
MSETTTSETFADLGIREEITTALAEAGIVNPFPIQALAIPLALSGTDLIGQARTGTGKTLAFGTSLLHRLQASVEETGEPASHGLPRALVITPTRELALQVTRDLELAGSRLNIRVLTIYGGTSYDEQLSALEKGIDVAVGTPGRLLDLVNRRALDLSKVEVLVLDEADEMLDLGFLPDIEKLLAKTPQERQSLLFSATMPAPILALARATLNRPVNIRAEGADAQATVPDITQFVYQAHDLDKPEVVSRIAQARDVGKVMVFCRTKRAAQRLADELQDRGFPAAAIHGDLNQTARERALKKFRAGTVTTLVATDVAARGIDITGVSHVINYECPDTDATYVHRIGRTGRAGHTGVAVTLVDWPDVTRWKVINKSLQLDFDTPVETYSSSPHLYTDLDIPEHTKGRLPRSARPQRENRARKETTAEGGTRRRRRRRATAEPQVVKGPEDNAGVRTRRRRRRRRAGIEITNDTAQ